MFSKSPNIFSLVNLDRDLPSAARMALPIQVKVPVTAPAPDSWEGLAGHVALPESKAITGVFTNTRCAVYAVCLDILPEQWTTCFSALGYGLGQGSARSPYANLLCWGF